MIQELVPEINAS